jgi:hypothetical protein
VFSCHFFVFSQRNGERKETKGPNALWNPGARKPFRYRFTHFFAKVNNFSFCEHGLKKAALTEVARNVLL